MKTSYNSIPCTRSMFQNIHCHVKYITMMKILFIDKTSWLFNINGYFQLFIDKCTVHIHLRYLKVL